MYSNRLSVRLPEDLAAWLRERARLTGLSMGQIVRAELERARSHSIGEKLLRHAGVFQGGRRDVSARNGFSTK